MTQTLPILSPFLNPQPLQQFLTNAQFIDEHHRLVESEPFQRAIQVAQAQYVRIVTGSKPPGMDKESHEHACANAFQRIQGATEIIDLLCKMGEVPRQQAPAKRTDNLE